MDVQISVVSPSSALCGRGDGHAGCNWFVRYKVWSAALVPLAREHALPLFALAQFALCMVLSTNAEGHGFYRLQNWYGTQVMVLEELVEICGYLALLLAQTMVLHHLRKQQR